jgi:hypothetical protein
MRQHVLEVDESAQVGAGLEVRPAGRGAHLPAGEPHVATDHLLGGGGAGDECVEQVEQPAGLRCQLIQRPAEHLMSEGVRQRDVGRGDFDVGDLPAGVGKGAARPLMLVQQRDRRDQRQVLRMVPPGPGPLVGEAQLRGVGVMSLVSVVTPTYLRD